MKESKNLQPNLQFCKQDMIYRQDAVNVADSADYTGLAVEDVKKVTDEVVKGLKQLPSAQPDMSEYSDKLWKAAYERGKAEAQPERKKGKWNFIGDQMFECSECGTYYTQSQFHQMRVRISDTEFPKFCPNCGADMREPEDIPMEYFESGGR